MINYERIRQQSKQVANYMKSQKYRVQWDCPHCGNSHNWWWDDEWEAYSESETTMVCDRCSQPTQCLGDGHGFYTPIEGAMKSVEDSRIEDLYKGLNALTKRVIELESRSQSKSKREPSFIDLIHGKKPPFCERFREGCEFNEETMPGESIAKILRFIAVEVERMTERGMGGSFTVSNLTVGKNLREYADEASVEGYIYDGPEVEAQKT